MESRFEWVARCEHTQVCEIGLWGVFGDLSRATQLNSADKIQWRISAERETPPSTTQRGWKCTRQEINTQDRQRVAQLSSISFRKNRQMLRGHLSKKDQQVYEENAGFFLLMLKARQGQKGPQLLTVLFREAEPQSPGVSSIFSTANCSTRVKETGRAEIVPGQVKGGHSAEQKLCRSWEQTALTRAPSRACAIQMGEARATEPILAALISSSRESVGKLRFPCEYALQLTNVLVLANSQPVLICGLLQGPDTFIIPLPHSPSPNPQVPRAPPSPE